MADGGHSSSFCGLIEFETDSRICIPEGEYSALLVHHETAFIFRTPKVYFWFRIVDPGYFDLMVYRAYRVKKLEGKPKKNGGFKVARGGDLYMDLVRLLSVKTRPDRISAAELHNRLWRISTRTVKSDYKQRPFADWQRYTVVDQILRPTS